MARLPQRHCRVLLFTVLAAGTVCLASAAGDAPALDLANAEWALTLDGLSEGAKPLALRVVTALSAVQALAVVNPPGLKLTGSGNTLSGSLQLVVNGVDKASNSLTLDVALKEGQVSGEYTGTWKKQDVKGAVSGAAQAGKGILEAEPKPPLELLKASYFGTAENDNFEGAAAGPDGSIYLVGNAGAPIRDLPGGVAPSTFGAAVAEPHCLCGFVLKLSADASQVLAYAEFGKGILHATAVAVTGKAVYVGGYASDALEPLLQGHAGLMTKYPLRTEQKLIAEGKMAEANGIMSGKDPLADRPWLSRLGAPCVLRFSTDLKALEGGTYLEGWEQVYDKGRICGRLKGMFREFFWQPINICPLKSGDIAVAHDGGYFRMLTDKDRELAAKLEDPKDRTELFRRLGFLDVPDYVSCLSADLAQRTWKTSIYTPPTVQEVATRLKKGWPWPHLSSPRTHRMRMDREENLWVAGWSASITSQEPWWSPFLWRLDPKTGQPARKLYEYDPLSGGGNRMGGAVADTALLTVAIEEDGNLLTSLISDGGNSVMGRGPLGNEGKQMTGPVIGPGLGGSPAHFWGQVQRVDSKTFEGLGGARSGPWGWTIDAAGLPDKHFLALGRWNAPLPWTPNAWWVAGALPNPNAFLRVVGPDYNTVFWTALPGVRPYELMPLGGDRYILVGFADKGTAPMKESLVAKPPGGEDAFFAIVKWKRPAP